MKWYNLLGFSIVYKVEVLGQPETVLFGFKYEVRPLERYYKWLWFTLYTVVINKEVGNIK